MLLTVHRYSWWYSLCTVSWLGLEINFSRRTILSATNADPMLLPIPTQALGCSRVCYSLPTQVKGSWDLGFGIPNIQNIWCAWLQIYFSLQAVKLGLRFVTWLCFTFVLSVHTCTCHNPFSFLKERETVRRVWSLYWQQIIIHKRSHALGYSLFPQQHQYTQPWKPLQSHALS
jgi:hypothetical protein